MGRATAEGKLRLRYIGFCPLDANGRSDHAADQEIAQIPNGILRMEFVALARRTDRKRVRTILATLEVDLADASHALQK